jgi:hypothetical protein
MLPDRFFSYKHSMFEKEIFFYHLAAWVVMAIFLAAAARHRGEKVQWIAFVPFLQLYDFARKLDLPPIVGVLLALHLIAAKVADYYYGFYSMVRIAEAPFVIVATLYLLHRLVRVYRLRTPALLLFAPVVTADLGLLFLGLAWLTGARPFAPAPREA